VVQLDQTKVAGHRRWEWNLRKTATASSGKPPREKKHTDGTLAREQRNPPSLEKFKVNPVEGARSLLQLRSREAIEQVLADAEFLTALKMLASRAAELPRAAVVLSRFALRPEFSSAAAVAIEAAGAWPEPSNFDAEHRRLAADALERVRPPWCLPWLGKALVSALPFAGLRRVFASRLILASGGLVGAVDALAKVQRGLKPKGLSQHLSLIRELRDCVRPALSEVKPSALVEFAQSVITTSSANDGVPLKRELAQLLCEAASGDRGLLLDDKIADFVATLDADSASKWRADAAKLAEAVRHPTPEPPRVTSAPAQPDQASMIREAAWSDADVALGRALRDMGALDRSFEQLESVVDGEAAERTRRAKNASNFVLQWVQQAANKRSIKALNSVGERVQFDPVYHDLGDDAAPGDYVRVVKPSIVRGDGAQQIVLLRGEVALD
jgi:hypothetical protein